MTRLARALQGSFVPFVFVLAAILGATLYLDGLAVDVAQRVTVIRLTPDGVLGPMTLIHFNTARRLDGPRLSSGVS